VARFIENSPARVVLLVIGQWQCRLVRDRQPYKVVDARITVDDYDKWLRLYRKLIVDRSRH